MANPQIRRFGKGSSKIGCFTPCLSASVCETNYGSTIGDMMAKAMACRFIDADDFHPQSNKEKMQNGIPLTDEDRIPWLEALRDALTESIVSGISVILGCSALKMQYREILRSADQKYKSGSNSSRIKFVLLDVQAEVLADRLKRRAAEGKHFMPAGLLQSQLDSLQIEDCEGVFRVDATLSPRAIVRIIQDHLLKLQE